MPPISYHIFVFLAPLTCYSFTHPRAHSFAWKQRDWTFRQPSLCACEFPQNSIQLESQSIVSRWAASASPGSSLEMRISRLSSNPRGFPGDSVVKSLPAKPGDMGSIPGSKRSHGGGNGNPLQYSCLGNSMGRQAWRATVHRVTKSQIPRSRWAL